jgi:hypothetical protein
MAMKRLVLMLFIVFTLSACEDFSNEPQAFLNPGNDTVEIGAKWMDNGAYLKVGFSKVKMETSDVIDTNTIGFYDVTYTVMYQDIEYEITRRVAVVERTQIQATLNPGIDTLYVGEIWQNAGVTVPEGATVVTSGSVSFINAGTYEITYTITLDNVSVTLVRYVTVLNK